MTLETGRSEQQQMSNGLAGLKGLVSDVRTAVASTVRRLAGTSATTAGAASQSVRSAAMASGAKAKTALRNAGAAARRTASAVALGAQSAAARVEPVGAATPKFLAPVQAWFARLAIVRFFSASLLRRILISNLIGFVLLVGGILYLGWFHTWLIDAKLDALKTQGKIIADAIAGNAKVVREQIIIDPDAIPDASSSVNRYPDDGLASLELSIHPEDVTPILRKLIQPTNTRARIYARDGTLIVDTQQTLARWKAMRNEPTGSDGEAAETQNIWTRLTRYLFREPLPVYQEIGTGNGTAKGYLDAYIEEVKGSTTAVLGDSVLYQFPEMSAAQATLQAPDLDGANVRADLPTCTPPDRAQYWLDINGGSDMGGATYHFHTQCLSPVATEHWGTSFAIDFQIEFFDAQGQIQDIRFLPALASEGPGGPHLRRHLPGRRVS